MVSGSERSFSRSWYLSGRRFLRNRFLRDIQHFKMRPIDVISVRTPAKTFQTGTKCSNYHQNAGAMKLSNYFSAWTNHGGFYIVCRGLDSFSKILCLQDLSSEIRTQHDLFLSPGHGHGIQADYKMLRQTTEHFTPTFSQQQ